MFDAYLQPIADAYAAAPMLQSSATETVAGTKAWQALADDSLERAAHVRLLLDVQETDDPEPYPDANTMCEDIGLGAFLVSTANSEHPVWTIKQNIAFRIVHDVYGHYSASVAAGYVAPDRGFRHHSDSHGHEAVAGFDWEGENAACAAHARLLHSEGARVALFTECIAQTGYAIANGEFGPQKVVDLITPMEQSEPALPLELRNALSAWRRGNV
jgi:hypothetical protein